MATIRIDDEVYEWLQKQARAFEDTPNTALRRIAGLDNDGNNGIASKPVPPVVPRNSGNKTPQSAFRYPIISILKKHGGQADRLTVLKELEKLMSKQLTEFDKSDISSGTIRWQKSAEWEVRIMREQDILKPVQDTRRGVWALTTKGKNLSQ